MEIAIVGIIALIAGYYLGYKLGTSNAVPVLQNVLNTQAIDRANYLQCLRRELANILVWRKPKRYLELYRQLHTETSSLKSWRTEEVTKRLSELSSKYPNYSDFDVIGTREYILYEDGISVFDDAEIEERYRDLVMFAALSAVADPAWKDATQKAFVHNTDERELTHLEKYVQDIEDAKLAFRIDLAIRDNSLARNGNSKNLNNDLYEVVNLPHFAENRYGVHFKRTSEYGIYSFYLFEDGRQSHSFYRSNATFEQELPIRSLRTVLKDVSELR
jgi:hypothetical protein